MSPPAFNLSSCPAYLDIVPASYYLTVGLAALYPLLQVVMILHFYWYRNTSVLLRKRSMMLILISSLGCMFIFFAFPLSYLAQTMPCAARGAFEHASIPFLVVPVIVRVVQYRSNLIMLGNIRKRKSSTGNGTDHIPSKSSSGSFTAGRGNGAAGSTMASGGASIRASVGPMTQVSQEDQGPVRSSSSCWAIRKCVLHDCCSGFTAFFCRSCQWTKRHRRNLPRAEREQEERQIEIHAHEWATGPYFVWCWIMLAFIPFLVFYLVKLFIDPVWMNCNFCTFDLSELIFTAVMLGILCVVGYAVGFSLRNNPDPLNIILEMHLVFLSGAVLSGTGLLLHVIDPGNLEAQGYVLWRWFDFFAGTLMLFFQTSFHVMWLRYSRWSAKHFNLLHFNSDELLADIRGNSRLLPLFRKHMQQELSYENLRFIEEVEQWKLEFRNRKDNIQRSARRIYQTYVNSAGEEPINISDTARQKAELLCLRGNVPITVFDEAMKEVADLVKLDALPRFLKSKAFKREARKTPGMTESALLMNRTLNPSPKINIFATQQPRSDPMEIPQAVSARTQRAVAGLLAVAALSPSSPRTSNLSATNSGRRRGSSVGRSSVEEMPTSGSVTCIDQGLSIRHATSPTGAGGSISSLFESTDLPTVENMSLAMAPSNEDLAIV